MGAEYSGAQQEEKSRKGTHLRRRHSPRLEQAAVDHGNEEANGRDPQTLSESRQALGARRGPAPRRPPLTKYKAPKADQDLLLFSLRAAASGFGQAAGSDRRGVGVQ